MKGTRSKPVLSENDIQNRLYGNSLGRRRSAPTLQTGPAAPPVWTGAEILQGELKRLQTELRSLRQEREQLAAKLQHLSRVPEAGQPPQRVAAGPGRFGRVLGGLALLGLVGYLFGVRMIQASPMVGDPTPYTVQVAVYDVRSVADQAHEYLRGLGYEALLVDTTRRTGRARYRLYVGSFVTQPEAERERTKLEMDPRFQSFKDAFVRIR